MANLNFIWHNVIMRLEMVRKWVILLVDYFPSICLFLPVGYFSSSPNFPTYTSSFSFFLIVLLFLLPPPLLLFLCSCNAGAGGSIEFSFPPTWAKEGESLTLQCAFSSALLPFQQDVAWFRDGEWKWVLAWSQICLWGLVDSYRQWL